MTTRTLLATLASGLLLAGCGGSSTPAASRTDSTPSTAATEAGVASSPAAAPGASAAAGSSAAPAATAGATATSSAAGSTTTTGTTKNSATASGFTAPGSYTYDTSGSITGGGNTRHASGTATLTVDPPSGGQQHSLLGNDQGRTEQTVVVRPDGTYLVRLVITNPTFSKDFRPAKPVLIAPDPATRGKSWSWTATSTDGKTHIAATITIGGPETLTVGGEQVATTIADSTLRITGDVTYTTQMRSWYDAADRLTVKEHTKGSGTFGATQFTTDYPSVLKSTKPS
jgi:hypothetical protein